MTAAQVEAALRAPIVDATWGADVLSLDGDVLDDLTDDLVSCTVSRNIFATVHGTVRLSTLRELDWRNVRVRPWQQIANARFYLGLFGLETPTQRLLDGRWDVDGYDMLVNLQSLIGQTRVLAWDGSAHVATSYTALMRQTIEDAGIPGARHQIDSASDAVVTDAPQCWPAASQGGATWLRCVNDLAQAVGYRGLYADELGRYVSQPYRAPSERPSEWLFHTGTGGDQATDIVKIDRQATTDSWNLTNWWRGIRRGLPSKPVEGTGIYTVDRTNGGRRIPWVASFDAASQDALALLVDNQVVRDTTRATSVTITTSPLPALSHGDIVTYRDADLGIDGRAQVTAWTQDLADGTCSLTLGIL